MDNRTQEQRDIAGIDELAGRSTRKLFSLSPNDVLVQISLPLVLILAIATRLMMIGQSIATVDQGPIILNLWKQQLIMRIEHTLDAWEKSARLNAFPGADRIHWQGPWPDDPDFSQLCRQSAQLADINTLALTLYRQALHYHPADQTGANNLAFLQDMYDPQEANIPPEEIDKIPEDLRITPEKRAYAMNYIEERCRKWKAHVEELQWSVVDRSVANLPLNDTLNADKPGRLMRNVSAELKRRGYPLLPAITNEYSQTHNDDNKQH